MYRKRWIALTQKILVIFIALFSLVVIKMEEAIADTSQFKHDPINLQMHVLMAESTYFVYGQSKEDKNKISYGTVFVLCHPFKNQDLTKPDWKGDLVLVTAAHVLDKIDGEYLTIEARIQKGDDSWDRKTTRLRIRKGHDNLYTKHSDSDVAAMWLVDGVEAENYQNFRISTPVPTFFLANDDDFKKIKLNIGSPLSCLGYPLGKFSTEEGFGILRGGTIASYPLFPLLKRKTFGFDFEVYPGNSGGPVYFFEPGFETTPGVVTMKKTASRAIVGLVTAQKYSPETIGVGPDGKPIEVPKFMNLGVVISAPIILETIKMLRERK